MKADSDNLIVIKTKKFALEIIELYQYLVFDIKEFIISKQLLRCGTSIGANVKEAIRGQSKADFGSKMNISLKEASETEYWLELLYESKIVPYSKVELLLLDCKELIRIITAIVKTSFNNK